MEVENGKSDLVDVPKVAGRSRCQARDGSSGDWNTFSVNLALNG